jgi:uncharacterized phage protein gp47/JayE
MAKAKAAKKPRLNVLFTPEEHERLVTYCAENSYAKSTLVARIVREYLDAHADQKGVRRAKPKPAVRRTKGRGKPTPAHR